MAYFSTIIFQNHYKQKLLMEALLSFFMHILSWVELYGSPKVRRLARDGDKHRLCIH